LPRASEDSLRRKVWEVINTVEVHRLFVHGERLEVKVPSGRSGRYSVKRLPLILTLAVINALVPRGTMLLYGGHGGGKTTLVKILGRMLTGKSLREIEEAVVRAHPYITEEKMVATLKPGKLLKEGVEDVVWRRFVTDFWKIVDEVNRLSPYAQDILLSLLAEGQVKYFDKVYRCENFVLYATLNPQDVGTFEMGLPFLDRFGIAVPVTMPSSVEMQVILGTQDEKLYGFDEYYQIPAILTEKELMQIWGMVERMELDPRAARFISSIISEYKACIRVSKENARILRPDTGLCQGCHFNTDKCPCNKILTPLSVRAAKDISRYAKALAWLLNLDRVTIEVVEAIAPFVVWHRVQYSDKNLREHPFYGDPLKFTRHIMKLVKDRFIARMEAYDILEKFERGTGTKEDIQKLELWARSDIVVKVDILPLVKQLNSPKYRKFVTEIEKAITAGKVSDLAKIREKLSSDVDIPYRERLLDRVDRQIHKLTCEMVRITFKEWRNLGPKIIAKVPDRRIYESLKPLFERIGYCFVRTPWVTISVSVTGTEDDDPVYLEISGPDAEKLLKILTG